MSRDDSDLDLLLDDDDEPTSSHQHLGRDNDDNFPGHDDDDGPIDLDLLDDESEEEEQNKREKKSGRAVPTDEEEEEEEEDEPEPKGKGVNPVIMIGAALSVAALAGVGGYVVLHKDSSSTDQPMVNTSMPAPSIEDLGKDVNVPSTNFAASDVENAIGSATDEKASHADPEAPIAQVKTDESLAASKATADKLTAPVAVSAPVAISTPPLTPSGATIPSNSPIAESAPVVAVAPPSPDQPESATVGIISPDQVSGLVAKAVQEADENKKDDLRDRIDNLQKTVEKLTTAKAPEVDVGAVRSKILEELRTAKESKEKAKADEQRVAIEQATTGKQRIPGFQVINATSDGTISIIKAPSGKTFALFKGERFKSNTGAVLEVKSIISDGKLVVAGDNWFIDETLVEIPKPAPQAKKNQAPVRSESTEAPEAKKQKAVSSLGGWGMHATFEGGGYLLKKPDGEYITVQKGESYPETGRITGIDGTGNLITEKGVIKGEM